MGWYKHAKSNKVPLAKQADADFSDPNDFDKEVNVWERPSEFQDHWSFDFGDYQRWVVDSFEIQLYQTKLHNRRVISLHVYNWHNGMMRYQEFWKYGTDEAERCEQTFRKIIKACTEVVNEMALGDKEPYPNSIVTAKIRSRVWDIDREYLPKTNIPAINYYYQKAQPVEDWRHSIYGNRYPSNPTGGY